MNKPNQTMSAIWLKEDSEHLKPEFLLTEGNRIFLTHLCLLIVSPR